MNKGIAARHASLASRDAVVVRQGWGWLRHPFLASGVLAVLLLAAACSGEDGPEPTGASERYPEGEVSVSVELLDTGLLKGNAAAEAKDEWRVVAISVSATTPKGVKWGVLEFPEGVGSPSVSEFFEVQVQELSRGEQLEITVTATFEGEEGETVERQAMDRWPP